MKLRVFEPRYLRLVREAMNGERDFALALINPYVSKTHQDRILNLATLVQIIDFEQTETGLLGITVAGEQKQRIVQRWQEDDQLDVAQTDVIDNWVPQTLAEQYQNLGQQLDKLLKKTPGLQTLYPTPGLNDASWLASRYLELLPMQPQLKQQLAMASSPNICLDTLQAWLAKTT